MEWEELLPPMIPPTFLLSPRQVSQAGPIPEKHLIEEE